MFKLSVTKKLDNDAVNQVRFRFELTGQGPVPDYKQIIRPKQSQSYVHGLIRTYFMAENQLDFYKCKTHMDCEMKLYFLANL